jgi:hypothetical protein
MKFSHVWLHLHVWVIVCIGARSSLKRSGPAFLSRELDQPLSHPAASVIPATGRERDQG